MSLGQVVTHQNFSTTHSCYWWPRRKDDEDGSLETDTGPTNENLQLVTSKMDWDKALPKNGREALTSKSRKTVSRRIHILGAGNIGKFVAHAFAGIPNRPPITLCFRRPSSLATWREHDSCIQVVTNGLTEIRRGFEVEFISRNSQYLVDGPIGSHSPEAGIEIERGVLHDVENAVLTPEEREQTMNADTDEAEGASWNPIYNIIISVKASNVLGAVWSIAHRLSQESTIVLLQNGMGIVEELNEKVFPDESTRPNYVVGITSHRVHSRPSELYTIVHEGIGTTAFGLLPRQPGGQFSIYGTTPSARYLLRTMTRTPVLAAVAFPPTDLLQIQLEKLAVNAIIGPLTSVLGCTNGELINKLSVSRIMRLLLAEISLVIRSLPELQNVPNVKVRFGPDRLEMQTIYIADKTAESASSMLRDVRSGQRNDIDYVTGYIIRRGEELGIKCVTNYMLLHEVKAKASLVKKNDDLLPIRP